jgi:ferredoxin-NADP reductase
MRVTAMTLEADEVVSLRLTGIDVAGLPAWSPGAHIGIRIPDGSIRQYSLCGDPLDTRHYRIAVLREKVSRGGSEYVHRALRVGDVVDVSAPRNHFELEGGPGYVFIAGGIGVTPILPMIAEAERSGSPWHLFYYGRSRTSMAFLGELAGYGDAVTLISNDGNGAPGLTETIVGLPAGHLLYTCGPGRLTAQIAAIAGQHGAGDRLRAELFAVPELHADEQPATDSFVVRLVESGLELAVGPDESILEVVLAAGIDVIHDCAEGICGSCETAVVSGEPEHRDYVLTAQEKADNSCMMICVSRSNCPVLVLAL